MKKEETLIDTELKSRKKPSMEIKTSFLDAVMMLLKGTGISFYYFGKWMLKLLVWFGKVSWKMAENGFNKFEDKYQTDNKINKAQKNLDKKGKK